VSAARRWARRIVVGGTALVVAGMVLDVWAGNPWLAIGLGTGYSYGLVVLFVAVMVDRNGRRP
jgi:hypothetical protein